MDNEWITVAIGDDMQEKPPSGASPRSPIPFRPRARKDVAGLTACIEADDWKIRAQMSIYHREVVAELDRLYEILYGTPPPKRKSASVHRIGRGNAKLAAPLATFDRTPSTIGTASPRIVSDSRSKE